MTTVTEIANCTKAQRGTWLTRAFYQGETNLAVVVFPYFVAEYKTKPTKSKALYIYDECVFAPEVVGLPTTLSFVGLSETVKIGGRAMGTIDQIREARVEAIAKSWFARITSSGDRKVENLGLGASVFDDLLAQHTTRKEGDYNFVWNDVLNDIATIAAPRSGILFKSMKQRLPATMTAIKDAGFDQGDLGFTALARALA